MSAARWRISLASRLRVPVIAAVFLASVAVVFLVGSYFAPHYVAAAILIGNSPMPNPAEAVTNSSLKNLISDNSIEEVNRREQLYPGTITSLAPHWAVAHTRSQFSLTRISGGGIDKVRLTYAGRDKDMVLRVTNALAAALAHASPTADGEESSTPLAASTPPSSEVPASSSPQKKASVAPASPSSPMTLAGLRRKLDQVGERQTILEQQLRQQTSSLAAIQQERQGLAAGSKDKMEAERERQLNKHDAAEAALRAQLAAATQTMNDLGQRYTQDYPEYLNAKDHVDELQARLNQFQSKPFVFVPEGPRDNSRRLTELNQEEAAIQATLQIAQRELDRNQAEARHVQAQVIHWSAANNILNADNASLSADSAASFNKPLSPASTYSANSDSERRADIPSFSILEDAVILSKAPRLNLDFLALVSLAFGLIAASSAVLLMEQPRDIIKGEEDLENELPASSRYLGGIPRIKHEIISR